MSYTLAKGVNFWPENSGLVGTVGYTLLNSDGTTNTARTTAGIFETKAGSGSYAVLLTVPDGWSGFIEWDTGGTNPSSVLDEVNPERANFAQPVTNAGPGTWGAALMTASAIGVARTASNPSSVVGGNFIIGQGDTGPALTETLINPDGTVADLTDAESVTLRVWAPEAAEDLIVAAATITDPANGGVSYPSWTKTDTRTPGVYHRAWVVTRTNGGQQTYPNKQTSTSIEIVGVRD